MLRNSQIIEINSSYYPIVYDMLKQKQVRFRRFELVYNSTFHFCCWPVTNYFFDLDIVQTAVWMQGWGENLLTTQAYLKIYLIWIQDPQNLNKSSIVRGWSWGPDQFGWVNLLNYLHYIGVARIKSLTVLMYLKFSPIRWKFQNDGLRRIIGRLP